MRRDLDILDHFQCGKIHEVRSGNKKGEATMLTAAMQEAAVSEIEIRRRNEPPEATGTGRSISQATDRDRLQINNVFVALFRGCALASPQNYSDGGMVS